MLRRIGVGLVTTAESGTKALQELEAGDYDIVISDVQMPEMNGMELTEAIRKSDALPKTPLIIGLTADTSQTVEEDCLSSGMADVIHKVCCGTYGFDRELVRIVFLTLPDSSFAPKKSPSQSLKWRNIFATKSPLWPNRLDNPLVKTKPFFITFIVHGVVVATLVGFRITQTGPGGAQISSSWRHQRQHPFTTLPKWKCLALWSIIRQKSARWPNLP